MFILTSTVKNQSKMPNTHVRVTVRSCRLFASVWPCKSEKSIVGQSALVICRRMQWVTLFTFCLPMEPPAKKAKPLESFFQSLSSAARIYLKRSPIIWKTTSRIRLNDGAKRNGRTPSLENWHEMHSVCPQPPRRLKEFSLNQEYECPL